MNGPRIVIMQLASPKQVTQWRDHCVTALGISVVPLEATPSSNRFVWQLSSANNRPLARSMRVHATHDEAHAEILDTRDRQDLLRKRPLKLAARSEYVWVANLDAQNVLMSARVYSTVRDTRDSILASAEAFSIATVARRPLSTARRAS